MVGNSEVMAEVALGPGKRIVAQVPSSKVTCKLPRRPRRNWRMASAFVSRTASITSLPAESLTATEIVAWCTSSPIYLASFMRALLVVGVDANDQTLLQKGALYNAFTGGQ